MPLIQRNSLSFSNLVYTSGHYTNPSWIVSLLPSKVGNNNAQWNASKIMNYPVSMTGASSGNFLMFTGAGWAVVPSSGGGSGIYFSAQSGVALVDTVLKMGGVGQLTTLNFEQNAMYYMHSGVVINDLVDGFINLENVLIGTNFGSNIENYHNVGLGRYTMSNTSGNRNVALGSNALSYSNAEDCIAIGTDASSYSSNLFYSNISLGMYSLTSSTSVGTTISIGESSFNSVNQVGHSVAIGYYAGSLSSNVYNSIMVGESAGSYSSGSGNIFIGYNSGSSSVGNNNFEIMTGTGTSKIGSQSNKLNLLNLAYGDISNKKIALGNVTSGNFSPAATLEIVPNDTAISISAQAINSYNFFTCKNGSLTSFNIDSSGNVSGVSLELSKGLKLYNGTPTNTSNQLYNVSSTLYWNGFPVTGVSYSSNSGILLSGNIFILGGTGELNKLTVKSPSTTHENVLEIKNSAGTVVSSISNSGVMSGGLAPAILTSNGITLNDSHHGKIIEHTGVSAGTYTVGTITIPSWQCTLVNFGGGITIASGTNVVLSRSGYLSISELYTSAAIYRRGNGQFFLYGNLNI